jgi:hypothetical protein
LRLRCHPTPRAAFYAANPVSLAISRQNFWRKIPAPDFRRSC